MNAIATVAPPMSVNDIVILARAFAKSGLFGMKTEDQAIALMMIAQAEGRHPAEAARDYDIIQGKPAKKAEAMLRDFIQAGGKVEWHALTDVLAEATFSHPQTGSVRIDWDLARANTAGLGSKPTWKAFPRQMLRSRVVSEGVRTLWPLATSGMYVPEEQADIERKDEHNGTTIEHAASDERSAINDAVPLKAAASDMKRPPRITESPPASKPHPQMPKGPVDPNPVAPAYESPPKSTPRIPRTGAEWSVWVDRLQITVSTLRGRREYHAITDAPAFQATIEAAPSPVRRDIDAILADTYENLPAELIENDPTISGEELPDVEIAGADKVAAG